jgi:meso-butanediol dehydrogenase / (S,S)-butanediol dehydrogenase / diacetyl reductase
MSGRSAERVALITGGGTGVGAAVAAKFSAAGGRVVLMGRRLEPLQQVAAELSCPIISGDAGNAADVRSAIELARERFGRLDVLIANAGGHGIGEALSTTDAEWQQAVHTNLTTAFVCIRECLPELISRRGSIVVVSSIAGLFAGPGVVGYVTTKHALIGLTRSIARDYGPKGIRINALCPGWIRTHMADEQMRVVQEKYSLPSIDDAYALVTKHVPLRRPATSEEIANVACFLASSEASIISGAVIVADGGATAVDLPTLAFAD